jgi:hypothetical protein
MLKLKTLKANWIIIPRVYVNKEPGRENLGLLDQSHTHWIDYNVIMALLIPWTLWALRGCVPVTNKS